jgi:hypothetical protein
MKKVLNTDVITNELEGASLFFTKRATPPLSPVHEQEIVEKAVNPLEDSPLFEKPTTPLPDAKNENQAEKQTNVQPTKKGKEVKKEKSNDDTVIPRHHGITTPRYHDTKQPQINGVMIGIVRKAVKEFGKEAATHRFTVAEKKEIADLIYTYKNRGIKTSENEIARIAVNFIVEDFKVNGENSVLHKILQALKE